MNASDKLLLEQLEVTLRQLASPEKAIPMAAYMKNRFAFLGIPKPLRKEHTQTILKELSKSKTHPGEIALALWELEEREFQYCAVEFLYRSRQKLEEDMPQYLITLVRSKSWWDTVDLLAGAHLGSWFLHHRLDQLDEIAGPWITDPDLWINRSAIICQLKFKEQTNQDFLAKSILAHAGSKEFFHQKAIGWALRQYARVNPQWVLHFVENQPLAPLSRREALKHLKAS